LTSDPGQGSSDSIRDEPKKRASVRLPNYDGAIVSQTKITGYLLSSAHHHGRGKAAFFTRYGFSLQHWEELASALLHHAADHDVVRLEDSPFGTRYIVEGALAAPDGRAPIVRSVWFIETGEHTPRFVSAYPLYRRSI
jgi:hypothetical protein